MAALSNLQPFTVCIDGGGSKTLLQVLDDNGELLCLTKNGVKTYSVEAGASNINVVRKEGVQAALRELFAGLKVGEKDFREILPTAKVIAGMAGVGLPKNLETVTSLFQELGVENLELLTDAALALKLFESNGIVLISGTGSVCFAKKEGVRQQVGGLGWRLGDEGSGYQIGLQAIAACMAEEQGAGERTSLTPALKAFFNVKEMRSLLPEINSNEMAPATIASVSPLVFDRAGAGDPVALGIVAEAGRKLRGLVATALKISQLRDCELHLWGGVFKGHFAGLVLQEIRKETEGKGITIVDQSSENAAVLLARASRKSSANLQENWK